jgi:hypothetical protein
LRRPRLPLPVARLLAGISVKIFEYGKSHSL